MVAINQTITIINKSGKIVSSTKHLANVFHEAKSAYNERKAELKALRRTREDVKIDEGRARKKLESLNLEDGGSRRSSRRGSPDGRTESRTQTRRDRPPIERGVSDSFYTNAPLSTDRQASKPSQSRRDSVRDDDPRVGGLARRHTDGLELRRHHQRPSPARRRASEDDIDMDLAYGELPPPLPERKYDDEVELRQKMGGLQRLLDECNCLQHSVSAIIEHLQNKPDALAAVALTLAEISNLISKLAPGALATMKGSFPAIIGLLASPEFAIAAGVGVGVTIIALGGYKIVKKIQAKRDQLLADGTPFEEPVTPPGEMEELRELDRIEVWRRGIADAEAGSLGTSVDGELITPHASRTLLEEGRLTEADFLPSESGDSRRKRKHRKVKSKVSSASRSSKGDGSSRVKSTSKKEPSGLRMLFKTSA